MVLTIDIKDRAVEKVLYLLTHLEDDVTILSQEEGVMLEPIGEEEPDFGYIEEARRRRAEGEKVYDIDEVLKALK